MLLATLQDRRLSGPGVSVIAALLLLLTAAPGCGDADARFARAYVMETMAQSVGGPAAAGRPGDFVLENDKLRAVIHGGKLDKPQRYCPEKKDGKDCPSIDRHNKRSTFPLGNGSLIDLDIQRPPRRFGVGKGKDAFYELGPMVNLEVNASTEMSSGRCDQVGPTPCPDGNTACARVSAKGRGDTLLGILALLDLAIQRKYPRKELEIVTDYDVCPGESFVRITTRARFYGKGTPLEMADLPNKTGLIDVLLGEHSGIDCAKAKCPGGMQCDDLLLNVSLGSLNTEMKRCRKSTDKLAGVLAGDFTFFSAKANIFVPGNGFDHDTFVRSVFDSGGDIFSNPLAIDYVAAVADGVSYAYFNRGGKMMIPVFGSAFTAAMSNKFGCPRSDPGCLKGKELVFRRFVSVGAGDIASALEPFYELRKIKTGRLQGHVLDVRRHKPVSNIDVVVFAVPKAWSKLDGEQIAAKSYAELVRAHREQTRSPKLNPLGDAGVVSHFRTDRGLDVVDDGSFEGALPVGRYILVTRDRGRPASQLVTVQVDEGETAHATVFARDRGRLELDIRDASGRSLPHKVTIGTCLAQCATDGDCSGDTPVCDKTTGLCTPRGGRTSESSCRADQRWDGHRCVCSTAARLPLELGGSRLADNTIRTVLHRSGRATMHLPPGTYEVIVSRGIEYEIVRRFVTIRASSTTRIAATLPKVIDTRGWISGDFHVHGPNSVDSGMSHKSRVTSYVAEGVELLSSSDHDQLTDYGPTIRRLGLSPWIKTQVGVEISPLDYGHFIGFPLRFNELAALNGGFYWRKGKPGNPEGKDWKNLVPDEIFTNLRALGSIEKPVAFIAHFYDHFAFYGIDPWTLEPPSFNIQSVFNPVLGASNFSGRFDALELFNGKNFDLIRRPTYKEARDYNIAITKLFAKRSELSYDELHRRWAALSVAAQRRFMQRTVAEQKLAIDYDNDDFECRCSLHEECGPNNICDRATGACVTGCKDKSSCNDKRTKGEREDCLPFARDKSRKTCQRVAPTCKSDSDCTFTWGSAATAEKCLAVVGKSGEKRCQIPCKSDSDCTDDPLRPSCDTSGSVCVAEKVTAATDTDPCRTLQGTMDDWFQMLNRGVIRPVLGNSDSHGPYAVEAGLPRNYLRSNTDIPPEVRERDVAETVHGMEMFPTYGPFLEFSVDGKGMGSTVQSAPNKPVKLHIRIQSPSWFDVDRLEIYRNGQLIRVVTGRRDCPAGDASCIRSPNEKTVNYDAEIEDRPARDAWYVVIAMGIDGKTLAPVYSSTPVARLGIYELVQRLTPILPPLRGLRVPFAPSIATVRPYAVTNPIFVDVDGDGSYDAPLSAPSWATESDKQRSASSRRGVPLSASPGAGNNTPSVLSHDHRMGIGRLRRDAAGVVEMLRDGQVSQQDLQRAIDALRYIGRYGH